MRRWHRAAPQEALQWLHRACGAWLPEETERDTERRWREAAGDPARLSLLLARAAFGLGLDGVALGWARVAPDRLADDAKPLACAMLLKRGRAEARDALARCIAGGPGRSRGWADLAAVLLAAGQREAALVCLDRGPDEAATALRRGLLARDLGRRPAAVAAFAQATRHDPGSVRAWFLLGTACQDARDWGAAAEAYRTALALDPARAEAAVNLGTVLQEQGDLAAAREAYRHALAARPDSFGRIAQALATAPRGELWLDLRALRRSLGP